jgi:putative transposase
MARSTRRDSPGTLHHVILRGVAGFDVFRDDADRKRLIAFIAKYVRNAGGRVLAWALMDNHIHLLIETGRRPLSEVVHGFAFRYAQYFNWRHARPGHLFQNRYFAKPVEDDAYLHAAIAYIHLNPLRAGMVRTLDDLATYRWTSYAGLLGTRQVGLVDAEAVLSLFSDDVGDARAALRESTASCLGRWDADPEWSWDTDERASAHTGETIDVAARMRERSRELDEARDAWETRRLRANRLRRMGWTVDRVMVAVCARQRIAAKELLSLSRREPVSDARALVAHLAVTELGASYAEVARRLDISETSAKLAARRGAELARERALALGEVHLVLS